MVWGARCSDVVSSLAAGPATPYQALDKALYQTRAQAALDVILRERILNPILDRILTPNWQQQSQVLKE